MSCIWGHDWSKWEEFKKQMFYPGVSKMGIERWQKRTCKQCGYTQEKEVGQY
jgi:hypothetical protein